MLTEQANCLTCNQTIAKTRKGLSSVLYRQIVRGITSKEDLLVNRNKLVQILHRGSNADNSHGFAQALDHYIDQVNREVKQVSHEGNQGSRDYKSVEDIKKWLLEHLVIIDYDSGEKILYRFLRDGYVQSCIDQPFTDFYANYSQWLDLPMTKNFVSRTLGAIGIKTKMVRVDFEDRKKSSMILRVSAEELCQHLNEAGY